MERSFLENLELGEGARLPRSAVDAIMAEYGRSVQGLQGQITTLTNSRNDYRTRAETAEGTLKKLPEDFDPDTYVQALEDAQKRAETAENKYNTSLYDTALEKALEHYKFSSPAAKREIMRQIREQKPELKDGEIEGFDELIEQIKGTDADAFAVEGGKPRFTTKTKGSAAGSGGKTREQIMAIPDRAERRAAIAANPELFNGGTE